MAEMNSYADQYCEAMLQTTGLLIAYINDVNDGKRKTKTQPTYKLFICWNPASKRTGAWIKGAECNKAIIYESG